MKPIWLQFCNLRDEPCRTYYNSAAEAETAELLFRCYNNYIGLDETAGQNSAGCKMGKSSQSRFFVFDCVQCCITSYLK